MTSEGNGQQLLERLSRQHIETQALGYINTGYCLKVFTTPETSQRQRDRRVVPLVTVLGP